MSWTREEIATTFDQIAKRSATDQKFRELCLADAAAAVKEATGREIPKSFNLRFFDKSGYDMALVLPDPVVPQGALSDKDLEAVAGGKCDRTCCSSAGPGYTPTDRGTVSGGFIF